MLKHHCESWFKTNLRADEGDGGSFICVEDFGLKIQAGRCRHSGKSFRLASVVKGKFT